MTQGAQAVTDAPGMAASAVSAGIAGVNDSVGLLRHPDRMLDALDVLGVPSSRGTNDVGSVAKLALASSEATVWTGEPGTHKALAWSDQPPLADIKAVGKDRGMTINDVLLAAIAGALRRYLADRNESLDEVIWMVPVNLKPFEDNLPPDLGNYFALVFLPMPLDSDDPDERLAQMHHRMDRIKHSDEAVLTFGLQRVVSTSPLADRLLPHELLRQQGRGRPHQRTGPAGAHDLRRRTGGTGRRLRPLLGQPADDGDHLQLQRRRHRRVRHRRRSDRRTRSARPICRRRPHLDGSTHVTALLMTGFPGFLGSALLPLLLARRENSRAVCLVQPQHFSTAEARIEELAAAHPHTRDRFRW